ncbi:hypothetical protein Ae406Ps2_4576 [Pseudonocardia sp. Ae406_Ps2]|nr:hypothetical protein Ae331Ps2_1374c [Pseudonocardia sp. Ae331_Ps2]OLM04576.1 hypothetical protein Ae406Ps2_4576 [Pseudonocardia sp. Ae406_Ps2]
MLLRRTRTPRRRRPRCGDARCLRGGRPRTLPAGRGQVDVVLATTVPPLDPVRRHGPTDPRCGDRRGGGDSAQGAARAGDADGWRGHDDHHDLGGVDTGFFGTRCAPPAPASTRLSCRTTTLLSGHPLRQPSE